MNPILEVRFFKTTAGSEPVREFLKSLNATDKKTFGEDIKLSSLDGRLACHW